MPQETITPNLFLFHGDPFLINEKINHWIQNFTEKYTADGIIKINAAETASNEIIAEITSPPFLTSKRLIIIAGIPTTTADTAKNKENEVKILTYLDKIPTNNLVIFTTSEPDTRRKMFKTLQTIAQISHLRTSNNTDINAYIIKRSANTLDYKLAQYLRHRLADADNWAMMNYVDQLKILSNAGTPITTHIIDELTPNCEKLTIWDITDALSHRNGKLALSKLEQAIAKGIPIDNLIPLLINSISNLITIKVLNTEKLDITQITNISKLHPYVVKLTINNIRHFKLTELKALLHTITLIDFKRKTGQINTTNNSLQLNIEIEKMLMNIKK